MKNPGPISVAAFVKRYSGGLRTAPREELLRYLDWYRQDTRMAVVHDGGRIIAVGMARCVNSAAEAADPYHHDEQGSIVWVDEIISRHPAGLPVLLSITMRRFGPRRAFAGQVFNRAGELRMLPWKTVERLIQGQPHHGFTEHSRAAGGTGL